MALSYFLYGFMEMSPTEEQQGKMCIVVGCLMAASVFLVPLLWHSCIFE